MPTISPNQTKLYKKSKKNAKIDNPGKLCYENEKSLAAEQKKIFCDKNIQKRRGQDNASATSEKKSPTGTKQNTRTEDTTAMQQHQKGRINKCKAPMALLSLHKASKATAHAKATIKPGSGKLGRSVGKAALATAVACAAAAVLQPLGVQGLRLQARMQWLTSRGGGWFSTSTTPAKTKKPEGTTGGTAAQELGKEPEPRKQSISEFLQGIGDQIPVDADLPRAGRQGPTMASTDDDQAEADLTDEVAQKQHSSGMDPKLYFETYAPLLLQAAKDACREVGCAEKVGVADCAAALRAAQSAAGVDQIPLDKHLVNADWWDQGRESLTEHIFDWRDWVADNKALHDAYREFETAVDAARDPAAYMTREREAATTVYRECWEAKIDLSEETGCIDSHKLQIYTGVACRADESARAVTDLFGKLPQEIRGLPKMARVLRREVSYRKNTNGWPLEKYFSDDFDQTGGVGWHREHLSFWRRAREDCDHSDDWSLACRNSDFDEYIREDVPFADYEKRLEQWEHSANRDPKSYFETYAATLLQAAKAAPPDATGCAAELAAAHEEARVLEIPIDEHVANRDWWGSWFARLEEGKGFLLEEQRKLKASYGKFWGAVESAKNPWEHRDSLRRRAKKLKSRIIQEIFDADKRAGSERGSVTEALSKKWSDLAACADETAKVVEDWNAEDYSMSAEYREYHGVRVGLRNGAKKLRGLLPAVPADADLNDQAAQKQHSCGMEPKAYFDRYTPILLQAAKAATPGAVVCADAWRAAREKAGELEVIPLDKHVANAEWWEKWDADLSEDTDYYLLCWCDGGEREAFVEASSDFLQAVSDVHTKESQVQPFSLEEELKHCGFCPDQATYFKTYTPVLKRLTKMLKDDNPTPSYADASAAAHVPPENNGSGVEVPEIPIAEHSKNLKWWDRWFETANSRRELVRRKKFPERCQLFRRFSKAVLLAEIDAKEARGRQLDK